MPSNSLTVAVAQTDIVVGDLAGNAAGHAEVVRAAGARLVVFPELSLTGYDLAAPSVALTDPTLGVLAQVCHDEGAVALVGAPITEDGGDVIAILRVDEHGVSVAARKVWVHGDENDRFRGGAEASVIDVDGWAVGLAICLDTNVQRHTAQLARRGVDLYAAAVLDTPGQEQERAARSFLTARALRAPVAIAHYRGSTPLFPLTVATSTIVNADGETVAAVDDLGDQPWVTVTLGCRPVDATRREVCRAGVVARARCRSSASPARTIVTDGRGRSHGAGAAGRGVAGGAECRRPSGP